MRVLLLSVYVTVATSAGCARPNRAAIQSADPGERILAIRTTAQAKDRQAVPLLVDRLEDEDEAVRFFAILALDKITGERFGYDYGKPARERAGSVERWRRFVRRLGHLEARSIGEQETDGPGSEARASGTLESHP